MLLVQQATSQEFVRDFGKCSMDELQLTHCPFDSTASAMVIYDIGNLDYETTVGYFFTRKMKIKIFSKAGIEHGKISIVYLNGNKVTSIKANTYNLVDGKIVKTPLSLKETFDEQLYDDWYVKKIALPEVREGSVIEITFKRNAIHYANIPTWEFQKEIPVLYSEYKALMYPLFQYKHQVTGEIPLDEYNHEFENAIPVNLYKRNYFPEKYLFVMKDIPAFVDQSFITCMEDYIAKVDFQLTGILTSFGNYESNLSTWPKLCQELLDFESFGTYIKSAERQSRDMISFLEGKTALEKVKWVDQHMKMTFTHNDDYSFLASETFKKILTEKSGNSADLNLAAIGMLKAAGIDVKPVLLSTRDHGMIQKLYPFVDEFNYVVGLVLLDSIYYVIDVTEPLLKFGDIPPHCLNDEGLIVTKGETEWLKLEGTEMSDVRYDITLSANMNHDSLSIECKSTSTYYEALEKRHSFKDEYESLAIEYIGEDYKSYDSIRCENLTTPEQPFIFRFSKKEELESIDNHLIINPFCGYVLTENPLKQPVRDYPVDFTYKWSRSFSVKMKIPEGYKISTKPQNLTVNNKNIRIVYSVSEPEPGIINILGVYQFKKDVYPASDYAEIKAYYDQIISKFNEKITFEPIGI